MISFTCRICGKQLSVPDELRGKKGKCRCGGIILVPDPSSLIDAVPPPAAPTGASVSDSLPFKPASPPTVAKHNPAYFFSAKLVVIIALGVVLGLFLWATANSFLAKWQEDQKRLKVEQIQRKSEEQSKQFMNEWEEARRRTKEEKKRKEEDEKEKEKKEITKRLAEYEKRLGPPANEQERFARVERIRREILQDRFNEIEKTMEEERREIEKRLADLETKIGPPLAAEEKTERIHKIKNDILEEKFKKK